MKKHLILMALFALSSFLFAQSNYNLVWSLHQMPFQPPQEVSEVATTKSGFDTDNDGKGEFISSYTDKDSNYVFMYEATGNDTYELVWFFKMPVAGATYIGIAVGDLDNNNKPEIVVAYPSYSDIIPLPPRLWVFEWNGVQGENKYGNYVQGISEPHMSYDFALTSAIDFRPYSMTIEDVDSDGHNEIIVGIRQGGRGREVLVLSVAGEVSGFGTIDIEYNLQGLSGGGLYNVTTGDLDGDGKREIYAFVWNMFSLYIIEATAPDTYELSDSLLTLYTTDYGALDAVRTADVNNDGIPEMYIAATEPDNTVFVISNISDVKNIEPADVKVLMNIPVTSGGKLRTLWIDDMDHDGKLSLMIAGETNGQIFDVEYKGSGDPTLATSWDVNVIWDIWTYSGFSPTATPTISPRLFYGTPCGDMDGDGKKEYIFVNYGTDFPVWSGDGYLWLLENQTLPSDVNEIALNPNDFYLGQNFPNPFNPSTVIKYQIPESGYVTLKVFDLLGKEVATLVNGEQELGMHTVNFDAKDLTSGVYIYQLSSGSKTLNNKMLLVK
ncbi:MAG TPA: T9SS type A sorting domain-containing protein [Ignavibacteriaceae bacterium]|nr:T9SS type A sorting domain-containing protein [Ignavibacteriaceae bacterium]